MREDTMSKSIGVYRRPRDFGMWMWFQFLCLHRGVSMSEAITEAVREWTARNDPERKQCPPGVDA